MFYAAAGPCPSLVWTMENSDKTIEGELQGMNMQYAHLALMIGGQLLVSVIVGLVLVFGAPPRASIYPQDFEALGNTIGQNIRSVN